MTDTPWVCAYIDSLVFLMSVSSSCALEQFCQSPAFRCHFSDWHQRRFVSSERIQFYGKADNNYSCFSREAILVKWEGNWLIKSHPPQPKVTLLHLNQKSMSPLIHLFIQPTNFHFKSLFFKWCFSESY